MGKPNVESKSEIVKPNENMPTAPDFMAGEERGITELQQHLIPPRLKVVQKQADDELLSQFGVGDLIMAPNNILVMPMPRDEKGNAIPEQFEPLIFTPIFYYTEYCVWNSIDAKGNEPAILERDFDPSGAIAHKCRNPKTRWEPHPTNPEWKIRNVMHMNFLCILYNGNFINDGIVMSFSRGDTFQGQKFGNLIKLRTGAPIFGCVFSARMGRRENPKGSWYGLDISNPNEGVSPWVEKEVYETYKKMHLELLELHKKNLIRVSYDDEVNETDTTNGDGSATPF